MVEEAAYFRAERRGFSGGNAVEDWIAAEREIAERLGEETSAQERKELAAYQKVREEVIRILRGAKRPISVNTIRQALDKAARELKGLGEYSSETVNTAIEAIRREIASTVEKLGSTWGTISERSSDFFEAWRDRGKDFLDHASTSASQWLEQFHPGKGWHEHNAGEMTQPGTFECTSCGGQIQLEQPDYLPACPYCQHRSFREKKGE